MKATTITARLGLPNREMLFNVDELYHQVQRVTDQRHRQG